MRKTIITLLCIVALSVTASAHSGRTDEYGGHHDNIHGGYHYHHGYPAHEHQNGVCPYIENDTKNHWIGKTESNVKNGREFKSSEIALTALGVCGAVGAICFVHNRK